MALLDALPITEKLLYNVEQAGPIISQCDVLRVVKDAVDPVKDEMLASFAVDSHFKSQPKRANLDEQSASNFREGLLPSTRPGDPERFRRYLTFKRDHNELLLLLLHTLVKDALHYEEIISGTTDRLTHIEVKVDLQSKADVVPRLLIPRVKQDPVFFESLAVQQRHWVVSVAQSL